YRYADRLLRRGDGDGRQHLSRRSERRTHADAVDAGSQWRLLPLRSYAALPADDHGPGLRLRGGQRRSAIAQSGVAAELDQTPDIGSQVEQGIWPRIVDIYPPGKPLRPRLCAAIRKRSRALCRQSVALGAGRRDRPHLLAWSCAVRIARPNELSADRRGSLSCDSWALWILLVPAPRAGCIDDRGPAALG